MNRALRYDGVLPAAVGGAADSPGVTPETIVRIKSYAEERRGDGTFDVVWEGVTPGDDAGRAAEIVGPFAEAGVTWWIESHWSPPNDPETLRERIRQGPPQT